MAVGRTSCASRPQCGCASWAAGELAQWPLAVFHFFIKFNAAKSSKFCTYLNSSQKNLK
jgi:hypothetical protein